MKNKSQVFWYFYFF